jgi:hypothetical protein
MTHDAVKDSPELQLELVQKVACFDSHQEAAYWAVHYQLPLDSLPYETKILVMNEQAG